MNIKPTDEQVKEFWEWCGGKYIGGNYNTGEPAHYVMPDGGIIPEGIPIGLNNLFEYAVPKVFECFVINRFECCVDSRRDGLGYQWVIGSSHLAKDYRTGEYIKDNTLALFWAIWEVMHG